MIDETRARRYCYETEKIENYSNAVADKEHVWDCHHRLEVQGQFRNSVKLLKRCMMYFNRPASELIFLPHGEHMRLHSKGRNISDEAKRKISEANKGNKYCLGKHHSEETRRKRSTSLINNPDKSKRVNMLGDKEIIFPSTMEAERWLRENGFPKADQAAICRCCRGKVVTAYKHRWKYV